MLTNFLGIIKIHERGIRSQPTSTKGPQFGFGTLLKYCWLHHHQVGGLDFFPESVWAKGSSNSGGLSSHLLIFTSSQLLIFTPSSQLLIFTSSSHLLIFSSLSSHLLIFTSCPLALLSLLLFYFSLMAWGSANEAPGNATLSHEMRFDRQKLR